MRGVFLISLLTMAAAALPSTVWAATGERPLAVVIFQGGLCTPGAICKTVWRIGPTSVVHDGKPVRALSIREARRLTRATSRIRLSEVHRHPFTGTCPTAYDAQEALYRFRGIPETLRSCTWDLARLWAVQAIAKIVAQRA